MTRKNEFVVIFALYWFCILVLAVYFWYASQPFCSSDGYWTVDGRVSYDTQGRPIKCLRVPMNNTFPERKESN